ncbi:hypothetical protein A6A08_17180 [Nocardiopsis sp. TSRI0078]|uniref:hypothetical protein n=1 Tax=unclassified Nocardiopsis TaxID=2649073 RepID=UPI00093D328B|nr:hypothetical protein [Nocardiopsis sp. TSRI0078]OKI12299.1 hypothetical protein A6A08_17180 [Nocardiopsis sp. TSRI0078]
MNAPETARHLPDPATARDLSRRTALLEFLINPDGRHRKYDFLSDWRPGWDLGTMSNGGGDEYAVALSDTAGVIRCFDHESQTSPYANDEEFWPGTVDALPAEFAPFLADPDFHGGDESSVSALLWRLPGDASWRTGVDGGRDDGSGWLLGGLCDENPAAYHHEHFQDYYECSLSLDSVRAVFEGRPLSEEVVAGVNSTVDPGELLRRVAAYPF